MTTTKNKVFTWLYRMKIIMNVLLFRNTSGVIYLIAIEIIFSRFISFR